MSKTPWYHVTVLLTEPAAKWAGRTNAAYNLYSRSEAIRHWTRVHRIKYKSCHGTDKQHKIMSLFNFVYRIDYLHNLISTTVYDSDVNETLCTAWSMDYDVCFSVWDEAETERDNSQYFLPKPRRNLGFHVPDRNNFNFLLLKFFLAFKTVVRLLTRCITLGYVAIFKGTRVIGSVAEVSAVRRISVFDWLGLSERSLVDIHVETRSVVGSFKMTDARWKNQDQIKGIQI